MKGGRMEKHHWPTGDITGIGEWTPSWRIFAGFQVKAQNDGTWIHILTSHLNEPNPDKNHVHIKRRRGDTGNSWVLCAIKVDGMREVNRRELIEDINRSIGLNLQYR